MLRWRGGAAEVLVDNEEEQVSFIFPTRLRHKHLLHICLISRKDCLAKVKCLLGYSLPAAPGKVSSAPELQGLKEAILYDQCLHPGVPWVPHDLVHQSVAAGALSSNPPAAESTVRPKLNTYMCTYILSNEICFKVYRNQMNFRTWSTLITADCSSACFS